MVVEGTLLPCSPNTATARQDFVKRNLGLRIKSIDAVLKNYILVADGIELPAFDENK